MTRGGGEKERTRRKRGGGRRGGKGGKGESVGVTKGSKCKVHAKFGAWQIGQCSIAMDS